MFVTALEIAMIVLFLLALADAVRQYKDNSKKLLLLVLALVYSIIFENATVVLLKGTIGSYFYNHGFVLWIWQTPLAITMMWAVLIYTAMHISELLELKRLVKPFMDALIVLLVALTYFVVAARQDIINWIGFTPAEGWFGVPADQFIFTMFIVFVFSFLFRYFTRPEPDQLEKTVRTEYYFLLPAFAYLAMLVMFSLVNLAEDALRLSKAEELFVLWVLIIFFAAMLKGPKHKSVQVLGGDNYTLFVMLFTRLLMYSYIMWSFVLSEIYVGNVVLVMLLIITIVAEILIYHSAFGHIGKHIHFGKEEMQHY
jgi:hypothetical protein